MRAAVATCLAAMTVVLAGCGSEDAGTGAASSAGLLKPGALVYWQTVSDPDSPQWEQVEKLLDKFPDGDQWVARLKEELEEEGVNWEDDVRPALGEVVDAVVYGQAGGEPAFVALTNPDDPQRLVDLVRRLNEKEDGSVATRVLDDWVAVSYSEAAIDAALKNEGGQSLADDESFKDGMEELPDDALTRVYVDPARAAALYGSVQPEVRDALEMLGLDDLDFAGAWATAKENGAELAFALRGAGAERLLGTGEPYSSALLEKVPGDAFAFFTFSGSGVKRQLNALRSNPLLNMGLREFEEELGVSADELVALFEGEVVFYARPSAPIPELTLLLDSDNEAQGRESAERVLRAIAQAGGAEVTEDGDVTTAAFGEFSVNLAAFDGMVVFSTSKNGIADLQTGAAGRLPDSERYRDALDRADAPDEYTGLAYVDLSEAVELILNYVGASGSSIPPAVARNLEPLRSLVAFGTEDGDLAMGRVFVEID